MQHLIKEIESKYKKNQVVDVKSGDIVRVHQKIQEGAKSRVQVFEGLVIRTDRKKSLTSRITVRRIASGVGVEKSFLLHSPLVQKIEVVKRSRVRRNNLSYMRTRFGKSARLAGIDFDKEGVNTVSIEKQIEQDLGPSEQESATAEPKVVESSDETKSQKADDKPSDEVVEKPAEESTIGESDPKAKKS